MDWISIVAAAVVGGLAGLIAALLTERFKWNRVIFVTVCLGCFALLNIISKELVLPRIRAWRMNQSLLEMPLYQLIKKGDPYTYEKLRSALSESSKKNEAQEQIASKLRSILFPTILKYIPVASDRSVVRYVEVMTKELEILEAADPLLCHQFLFPQSGVFFNSTMYFTRDIQREDLDALAEVIRSAVESPQAPPDAQTADQLLNLLRNEMEIEHGSDMGLLGQAQQSSINKAKVCSLTISMYRKVLSWPERESGFLLRYLLSSVAEGTGEITIKASPRAALLTKLQPQLTSRRKQEHLHNVLID